MSQEKRGTYEITVGDRTHQVRIQLLPAPAGGGGPHYALSIDGAPPIEVEALRPEAGVMSLMMDGRAWEAGLVSTEDGFVVDVLGIPHEAQVIDPRRRALRIAKGGGASSLKTQMPGRIVRLLVSEGEAVKKGQPVLVIEAMKMENELKAPQDGVVSRIHVKEGDVVEARAQLLDLG
jgi:biotin carboxyl carrier protein